MRKPQVALLRGPLLNPFEMQSYEPLQDEFDLTVITPHQTQFDISGVQLHKESLWCPIAGGVMFEREKRKWQAARDLFTGDTFSFCGMRDRLKGFDIYHVKDQAFCFSYEAALTKKKFGGKLIVTQMENIPHLNEKKFMERHIKNAVREQADLFLAASQGAVETLLAEGVSFSKIRRISNAVNTDYFSPGTPDMKLRKSLGIPDKAFLVIYVGRLNRDKGVFTLLEAMKTLQIDTPLHLLLVGKDEQNINGYIQSHGLSQVVHTVGFVSYTDMPRYYRLAQLAVLPSLPTRGWIEQFGYVIIEAMACGLPVIGSDCGTIPEVINDFEMIFPAGSVPVLEQLLRKLSGKPLQPLKIQSRKRACALYASSVLTDHVRSVYRNVLEIQVSSLVKKQEARSTIMRSSTGR